MTEQSVLENYLVNYEKENSRIKQASKEKVDSLQLDKGVGLLIVVFFVTIRRESIRDELERIVQCARLLYRVSRQHLPGLLLLASSSQPIKSSRLGTKVF